LSLWTRVSGENKKFKEDLIVERVAVESYAEIARWLGEDDSTTRRLIEQILKMEEKHAHDLADLLTKVN
jgi:bacterioferritin